MKTEEMEAKIKTLESQVKTMESQIKALQTLLDIEEIKKIQRAYGYYLGLVDPKLVAAVDPNYTMTHPAADLPRKSFNSRYPSGYIFPFHYRHPVTGEKTTEAQRNASIEGARGY